MKPAGILKRLVQLSHELGREDRHLAILGEGNVSADLADGTFYAKASGSQMAVMSPRYLTLTLESGWRWRCANRSGASPSSTAERPKLF